MCWRSCRTRTLRVEALEAIPEVVTSSELVTALNELSSARVQLRSLRQRFTDEYREVQDLIRVAQALETETVPDLLRSVVQRVSDAEELLQARIDEATLELGDIPPRTIEEAGLERRVALAEQLYGDLRGRYQEAALASASSMPDVRVLDRASPPTVPDVDARLRAALLFLLAGLGAGLGVCAAEAQAAGQDGSGVCGDVADWGHDGLGRGVADESGWLGGRREGRAGVPRSFHRRDGVGHGALRRPGGCAAA